ncbi:MAG: NUDIX hydrolase [archaeon]
MNSAKAIIIKDNKILMTKLCVNNKFIWALPGGRIEDGETAEAALKRELIEELGAEIKIIRLLGEYHFFREFDGKRVDCKGYECILSTPEDELVIEKQTLELKWVPLMNISKFAPQKIEFEKLINKIKFD